MRRRLSFGDSGALPSRQRDGIVDRRHVPAGHGKLQLAGARRSARSTPARCAAGSRRTRPGTCTSCSARDGSSGYMRIDRLDELRAQLVAQHGLDLLVDLVADRHVVLRVLHHELAHDADAHALAAAWPPRPRPSTRKLAYGSFGISAFGIAVKMSLRLEALDRIEHRARRPRRSGNGCRRDRRLLSGACRRPSGCPSSSGG